MNGLVLRNMAGRERDAGRLYESGYKQLRCQPKILGANYFEFKRTKAFCSGHRLSKHKITRYARNFGAWPSWPPSDAALWLQRINFHLRPGPD